MTIVTPLLLTQEKITWLAVAPIRLAAASTIASTGPPGFSVIELSGMNDELGENSLKFTLNFHTLPLRYSASHNIQVKFCVKHSCRDGIGSAR